MSSKAVVTGASSGIGKEIALYLSQMGYRTVLVGRNTEALNSVSILLTADFEIECADLSRLDDVKGIFEKHKDADIIVNCAGGGVFGEFDLTDLDRELEMISTNIRALHVLTKLYYIEFVKRGSGNILNVSSSASYFSGPAFSSYYASKAYVTRLTRALQREVARNRYGVGITLFCPGPVKTDFGKKDGISDGSGAISPIIAAQKAVDGMIEGREVVYPNLRTAMSVLLSRLLPERLSAYLVYKIQLKKALNSSLPLVKNRKV